jgi:hypothetical protein
VYFFNSIGSNFSNFPDFVPNFAELESQLKKKHKNLRSNLSLFNNLQVRVLVLVEMLKVLFIYILLTHI